MDFLDDFILERLEITDDGRHHLTVSFPATSDCRRSVRIERGLLVETHKARTFFVTHGARLPPDPASIFNALLGASPKQVIRLVSSAGWHGDAYISRCGCMTRASNDAHVDLSPHLRTEFLTRSAGTKESYLEGLRPFLLASPYLILTYVAALTAPFASRVRFADAFGLALTQRSSTGKTLALRVAQSLMMPAQEKDLVHFGDTTGVLLDRLPTLGGQAACFTDVKTATSRTELAEKIRALAFSATGGLVRARKYEAKRPTPQFIVPLLSLENSVAETFSKGGLDYEDGEAVRLLDVPVPSRDEGGIFPGAANPAQLAADLKVFLDGNFGTVGPSWVACLATVKDWAPGHKLTAGSQQAFVESLGPLPAHHARIAAHFGLLHAIGTVAINSGFLPIPHRHLMATMRLLLRRTLDRDVSRNQHMLTVWSGFLRLLNDETAVPTLSHGERPAVLPTAGFRRRNASGDEEIFLRAHYLNATFGEASIRDHILPMLVSCSCLPAKGEKTSVIAQKGLPRQRYYHLRAAGLASLRTHLAACLRGFGLVP